MKMHTHSFFVLSLCVLALSFATDTSRAVVLFNEDFSSVTLTPTFTLANEIPDRAAWSDLATAQTNGALSGWADTKEGVLGGLDPANSGVREFYGWTFLDKDWWIDTAGDQDRSSWNRGYGTVGVADNDEFDDFSFGPAEDQGLTNDQCDTGATATAGSGGCYAATLTTPQIDISGQAANSVNFIFDSSWRPEDDGARADDPSTPVNEFAPGTPQTGRLEVSFDNGPFQELFTYTSDNSDGQRTLVTGPVAGQLGVADDGSGNFFAADLELVDQVIDVPVSNPSGASQMRIRFNTYDAGNDWWWGVDNLQAYTDQPGPRDPALKVVIDTNTNEVSIVNNTPNDVDLTGYQIVSEAGVFDESAATFMSDSSADWTQLTAPGAASDLSEGVSGFNLASGASISLGSAWVPYFEIQDDISMRYVVSGQTGPIEGLTEVDGSTPVFLDYNNSGALEIGDWVEFLNITDDADLSDLSRAQAYLKGDIDADGRLGVNDFIIFQREFDLVNGAGSFQAALAAVPEPSTAGLLLIGCLAIGQAGRKNRIQLLALLVAFLGFVMPAEQASAAKFTDRLYLMGDEAGENAVPGNLVTDKTPTLPGLGNNFTADSAGTAGALQLVDIGSIDPSGGVGAPSYVAVNDRPDFGAGETGIAIEFDGVPVDVGGGFIFAPSLFGERLGTPETSVSSTENGTTSPGSINYRFIRDRGMQFWTKPNTVPSTMSDDPLDDVHIVMDTNNHGVLINSQGNFAMRYNTEDFEGVGPAIDVQEDSWYHIMVVRPDVLTGSVMYVNGIATAIAPGDYISNSSPTGQDSAPLVVGANTETDSTFLAAGGGLSRNAYAGIVDDLEMFVMGFTRNSDGSLLDYGVFDFATDNDYAVEFGPSNPLDLVGNNGVDMADVVEFVNNWQFSKTINGSLVGDLETVAKGDFNYDGVVDIGDWQLLNQANPALGATALSMIQAIPEPCGIALAMLGCVLATARRQR